MAGTPCIVLAILAVVAQWVPVDGDYGYGKLCVPGYGDDCGPSPAPAPPVPPPVLTAAPTSAPATSAPTAAPAASAPSAAHAASAPSAAPATSAPSAAPAASAQSAAPDSSAPTAAPATSAPSTSSVAADALKSTTVAPAKVTTGAPVKVSSTIGQAAATTTDAHPIKTAITGVGCQAYMLVSGCDWTSENSCPGQTAGTKSAAKDDGSHGYFCCCKEALWKKAVTTEKPVTQTPMTATTALLVTTTAAITLPVTTPVAATTAAPDLRLHLHTDSRPVSALDPSVTGVQPVIPLSAGSIAVTAVPTAAPSAGSVAVTAVPTAAPSAGLDTASIDSALGGGSQPNTVMHNSPTVDFGGGSQPNTVTDNSPTIEFHWPGGTVNDADRRRRTPAPVNNNNNKDDFTDLPWEHGSDNVDWHAQNGYHRRRRVIYTTTPEPSGTTNPMGCRYMPPEGCDFPFTYQGIVHNHDCVTDDPPLGALASLTQSQKYWCPTPTVNGVSGQRMNCKKVCDPGVMATRIAQGVGAGVLASGAAAAAGGLIAMAVKRSQKTQGPSTTPLLAPAPKANFRVHTPGPAPKANFRVSATTAGGTAGGVAPVDANVAKRNHVLMLVGTIGLVVLCLCCVCSFTVFFFIRQQNRRTRRFDKIEEREQMYDLEEPAGPTDSQINANPYKFTDGAGTVADPDFPLLSSPMPIVNTMPAPSTNIYLRS